MIFPRALAVCLRILAVLQILTAGIAIIPLAWIEAWHVWAGLGAMSHDPMLLYVVRGGAFVQGAIGVLIWIMATDTVRYRPLIVASATIYFVGGPAFYLIDSVARMPRFWCLLDSVSCLLTGGVLLVLCFRRTVAPRADRSPA